MGSQVIVPYRGDGMNVRHLKLAGDLGQVVPVPVDLADEESVMRAVRALCNLALVHACSFASLRIARWRAPTW